MESILPKQTRVDLNNLNDKYKISSAKNSLNVSALMKHHKPMTIGELEQLIKGHNIMTECECGETQKGTIGTFAKQLYNHQITEWNTHRYTPQDVMKWMKQLFIDRTFSGFQMEQKAMELLPDKLHPDLSVRESTPYEDLECSVDLVIQNTDGKKVLGIQVKPENYKNISEEKKQRNEMKQHRFNAPVLNLYYDDDKKFTNLFAMVVRSRDLNNLKK